MRNSLLFLLMIAPMLCWGQSSSDIPNCGAQTEVWGAACFVSDDVLVTSHSLTEFSDEGSIKIVVNQGGKDVSYNARLVRSNATKGWSILKIEDPNYRHKVTIKYGITSNPLKTVFYLNDEGGASVGKLYKEGRTYSIRQSVTRDDFDTPMAGTPVFDNLGHFVAIVSEAGSGTSAQAIDALSLKDALKDLGITLVAKDVDGNPAKIMKEMQPCMVRVRLNVSGSSYYSDYCAYYTEAHSELESKNYEGALNLFSRAGQSKRKPQNNDVDAQMALCKYWLFRNKGDEFAGQYQIDLAKHQYDEAYAQGVSGLLLSEILTKKAELQVFSKSVEDGDAFYSSKDYEKAYEKYWAASNATVKPKTGSEERIALESKLKKAIRKCLNARKTQVLMVNAAPGWSYGLTYGVAPRSVGWYINLMTGTDFSGFGTPYSCGADRLVNEQSVTYSGQESHLRMFGQTGLFFKAGNVLSLKFGAGYGVDNYYLATQAGDWVLDEVPSYNGLQGSIGFMLWMGSWSVSFDVNAYGVSSDNGYPIFEPQLGVGFRF